MRPATILTCGDLVRDTHIARLSSAPGGYFQPHTQSQLCATRGGAWYLSALVYEAVEATLAEAMRTTTAAERALDEATTRTNPPASTQHLGTLASALDAAKTYSAQFPATYCEAPDATPTGVAKAFSVWELFEGKKKPARATPPEGATPTYSWPEGEALPSTWRIKEFLGCQTPDWTSPSPFQTGAMALITPHVAVIDDLGLGFADHHAHWPTCLQTLERSPHHIVIKASRSFDRPLWKRLLDEEWAKKTTVVVSAAALREEGARLSRGLSWDRTIADVKSEFQPGGAGWVLRRCQRVVVTFDRSGAAVLSRTARTREEIDSPPPTLRFERFVFDPDHLEDTWGAESAGTTFGTMSAVAAQLVVDTLMTPRRSSHVSVSRGLWAARRLHTAGGGTDEKQLDPDAGERGMFDVDDHAPPETKFFSAFPRELLDAPQFSGTVATLPLEEQTLLTDALGLTPAFPTVAAEDIVRHGRVKALRAVPRLQIGDYFTVDRDEIERLNTVGNLILDYGRRPSDNRPLSLPVFGPPGSGKSFAIKQLAEPLYGKERAILEFNLTQFENVEALHEAFHQVRDKSVKGQIPFVFWDEFDCAPDQRELRWLKEFLAPMQDSQFVARGTAHPFGKCIFIFAGGTAWTFADFESQVMDEKHQQTLRSLKAPDFVSRLRGYVDIKGPNPTSAGGDHVYLIRRALLLRSLLERHHPGLVHPATKEIQVTGDVLHAFLHVGSGAKDKGYRHGSRSMEAIVSLSRLHGFGAPPLDAREADGRLRLVAGVARPAAAAPQHLPLAGAPAARQVPRRYRHSGNRRVPRGAGAQPRQARALRAPASAPRVEPADLGQLVLQPLGGVEQAGVVERPIGEAPEIVRCGLVVRLGQTVLGVRHLRRRRGPTDLTVRAGDARWADAEVRAGLRRQAGAAVQARVVRATRIARQRRGRRRAGRARRRAGRSRRAGWARRARRRRTGREGVRRAGEAGRGAVGSGVGSGRARRTRRRARPGCGRPCGTRRAGCRPRARRERPRKAGQTRLVARRAERPGLARLTRVGQGIEPAHQLRRTEVGLHRRVGWTGRATARPQARRDRHPVVAMAVVALFVVVLVGGIEVVEAGGLLLVAVTADVRVVQVGGGAAVAGVCRRVLHETVVLPGETQARAEDRGIATGEVDVACWCARICPHLHVVGAADPVGRVVAVLEQTGDLAEDVATAADVVGELRAPVRPADRDGERQPLPDEVVGGR
jgi:hypothetical protein